MPGKSYRTQFRFLLLCWCDIFLMLINSLRLPFPGPVRLTLTHVQSSHVARLSPLTPSLSLCHFKTTNESAKFETHKPFCVLFRSGMWKLKKKKKILLKTHSVKSRSVKEPENNYILHCLQARPCIFQPWHFSCWGSEGVKLTQFWCVTIRQRISDLSLDIFLKMFYLAGHRWIKSILRSAYCCTDESSTWT